MSSATIELLKNAMVISILTSIVCGIVGTLVYSNRLTFMAGGIAHAAYGGIGLGIFLNKNILATLLIFTLCMSLIMAFLTNKQREKSDSVIGLLWAGGMALGIILLDLTPGYHGDIMSYLFGSILIVSNDNILFMFFLTIFTLLIVLLNYHKFEAISFDYEFAATRGINVSLLYLMMIILIAIAVVMLIRVVGIILVIALLSIPPYLSSYSARTMKSMMLMSFLWSLISCTFGMILSFSLNLSSGASIIAVAVLFGFVYMTLKKIFMKITYGK